MRALVCRQWCKFHELKIEEIPEPTLVPKSVRIAVDSVGVSFATNLWVEGKYQRKPRLPFTPGIEVSGTVCDLAPGVTRCKPGDRVVATVDLGGMAELVLASEVSVFPVPDGIDLSAAACLPSSYTTAYGALIWKASLIRSETLLVFGAAGGVGLAAVQIGKAVGASVIACASSQEKLDVLRVNGADHVINYTTQDVREEVLRFTKGEGAQVVFDPVGGDAFKAGLRSVCEEGRILTIGFSSGGIPQIPANILLVKSLTVLGFDLGKYVGWGLKDEREKYADLVLSWNRAISKLCETRKINPTVYRAFPLDQYREAMDLVLERKVIGKVLLKPGKRLLRNDTIVWDQIMDII